MSNQKKQIKQLKKIKEKIDNTIQIPLLVKEKNDTTIVKNKPTHLPKETKKDKVNNAILLGIIVLLLLITSYVIISRIIDSEKKPTVMAKTIIKKNKKQNLNTKWITADDSMFYFDKEGNFYWYDDYTNKKDNYYDGTYTFKQGQEALKEMGYDEKEFVKTFGEKISEDNIYSLELTPVTAFIEGRDQSSTYLPEGTKWWYILIIKSEGGAIAYNKTLDIRYHLESQ